MDGGGKINIEQPLLHFYFQHYLPAVALGNIKRDLDMSENPPMYVSESSITNNGVEVGGVKIRFRRTVRVPDNDKTHALPPDMGPFDIFPIGNLMNRLPKSIVKKGGAFLHVSTRGDVDILRAQQHTLRSQISVGGVNALTGLPQDVPSSKKQQDYLAVNGGYNSVTGGSGQLWLDGISVAPGIVRQFVAMPLGKGYTVEGQLTGKEDVGGVQIHVYPVHPTTVSFKREGKNLNFYKTPKQLRLSSGKFIVMRDLKCNADGDIYLGSPTKDKSFLQSSVHIVNTSIEFQAREKIPRIYVQTPTGQRLTIYCDLSDTVEMMIAKIEEKIGIPGNEERLFYNGARISDDHTLHDCNIKHKSRLDLCMKQVGRGNSAELLAGFASGGRISQKVNRDPLPVVAYDQSKVARLHVTILNAAHFAAITGLCSPPSPISAQTYLNAKLPWFKMYDEHIPAGDNTSSMTRLGQVASIAQIDRERASKGQDDMQAECGYCKYGMATVRLQPCGHKMCDDCTTTQACPQCMKPVNTWKRFAVSMPIPGNEDDDGVEADSLDQRIIELRRSARRGKIASFKLEQHSVSALHGKV